MSDQQETARAASTGSTLAEEEYTDDSLVMHAGIAQEWELWSHVLGRTALPRLEQLQDALPTLRSAVLSTADGLNLCTVGIPAEDVGRMAALNSSLFAVASAQAEIARPGADRPERTMVNISAGEGHLVLVSIVHKTLGHLLLSVSADDVQLGTMVVNVRQAADDLSAWLNDA